MIGSIMGGTVNEVGKLLVKSQHASLTFPVVECQQRGSFMKREIEGSHGYATRIPAVCSRALNIDFRRQAPPSSFLPLSTPPSSCKSNRESLAQNAAHHPRVFDEANYDDFPS